jgi:hypothetical protein
VVGVWCCCGVVCVGLWRLCVGVWCWCVVLVCWCVLEHGVGVFELVGVHVGVVLVRVGVVVFWYLVCVGVLECVVRVGGVCCVSTCWW